MDISLPDIANLQGRRNAAAGVRSNCRTLVAVLSAFERNHFFPAGLEELETLASPVRIVAPEEIGCWKEFLAGVQPQIVLGGWDMPGLPDDPDLAERVAGSVEYLCYMAGSIRAKIPRSYLERGLLVTNWGTSISRVVAESGLMMILCALRSVALHQENMHHRGSWRSPDWSERSLFGRRVGLHGFGRVAQELVRLLKPFGVPVISYSPGTPRRVFDEFNVRSCTSLAELFANSEVFVEVAALNAQTEGIVGRDLLRLLPEGAAFVNIGRGKIVRTDDLIAVALERKLRVCLDVFEKEPLPPDSPLRRLPEFLLMPHQSGPTLDRFVDAGNFALRQIRAFVKGEPVETVVTAEIWDAST